MFKMVIWADWLEACATALGTTTMQAGVIMSLTIIISLILALAMTTRGRTVLQSSSMVSLLGLILFTYIGWLPLWTGSALALVTALFIAKYVGEWF